MNRTRVLLAEDNATMAKVLESILELDFDLVATVGDGRAMVEVARQTEPDVIVADISMPLLSGLEATRQIREHGLRSKIILLTMHADVPLATEAFRAGVSGYLLKAGVGKELIKAIHEVQQGRRYISPAIGDEAVVGCGVATFRGRSG
jgi:DNA-binding NarL/FixJ family response regulator